MKKGWTYKKLGDVVSFARGLTYSKRDEVEFSDIIVLRSNNIDLSTGLLDFSELKYLREDFDVPEEKKLKKGCLFICMSNGSKKHLGKVAYVPQNYGYAFGGFMGQITPCKDIDGRYLFFFLSSPLYKDYIIKLSEGANINNLKYKDLELFDICFPNLYEQERIVSYLDKAFEYIDSLKDNAQKQLDDARKLFQAVLTEAMTPKEGWKEATIQEAFDTVTDFVAAGSFADLRKNVIYNSNPDYAQLVRTTDLKHSFNNDSFVYVDEHAFKYLWRVNLNEECIILPNVGVNCGEIYYVTPKSLKYKNNVLGPNAILIRSHVANNLFMSYYMKSVYFQEKIQQITSRMAQPKFNKTNLKTLIVCLPKIVEQKAIVKDLEQLSDNIRKMEEINRKTIAECDALKQSILRQIFE